MLDREQKEAVKRNDSRSPQSFTQLHHSFIGYFLELVGSNRNTHLLLAIYFSELLNIERWCRYSNTLIDDEWFFAKRDRMEKRYNFTSTSMSSYDNILIENDLIRRKKNPNFKDRRNYYSINHIKVDRIMNDFTTLYYE